MASCRLPIAHVQMLERRWLLAAQAVAELNFLFRGMLADRTRNLVYVADATTKAIRVIDTDAAAQLAQISLEGEPRGIALSVDSTKLYVALPNEGKVQVLSTVSFNSQRVIDVEGAVEAIAIGAGDALYSSRIRGAFTDVVRIDPQTGIVAETLFSRRTQSLSIQTDPTGQRLYVTELREPTVELDIASPENAAVVRAYANGTERVEITSPDVVNGKLYYVDPLEGVVSFFDMSTGMSTRWPSTQIPDDSFFGYYSSEIQVVSVRNEVWVASSESYSDMGKLRRLSAITGQVVESYDFEDQLNYEPAFAVTPNGRAIFATASGFSDYWTRTSRIGIVGASTLSLADAAGIITGQIYHDENQNRTRDAGEDWFGPRLDDDGDEAALPNIFVYLDVNNNGIMDRYRPSKNAKWVDEPSQIIRDAQSYRLVAPAPGTYAVRIAPRLPGNLFDAPIYLSQERSVQVAMGQQVLGIDLPLEAGFNVAGRVYVDVNLNARYDTGEPVVAGETVYIDRNNDGSLQPTEPRSDLTESGWYSNYSLESPMGQGTVRLENTRGYSFTTAASVPVGGVGGERYNVEFGIRPELSLSGTVFSDWNQNGKRDHGEPIRSGVRVWIDEDGDRRYTKGERTGVSDADGRYVINGFRLIPNPEKLLFRNSSGERIVSTSGAPTVAFTAWRDVQERDFGFFFPSSITANTFLDNNANRKFNKGDRMAPGVIVYIDANNNGKQDKIERFAITDPWGDVTFDGLSPGEYVVRVRFGSNVTPTTATAFNVDLKEGEHASLSAGMRPIVFSSIAVNTFLDLNGNRKFNKGDRMAPGVIVYIDANNNGKQDKIERFAITDPWGDVTFDGLSPGEYVVRVRVGSKMTPTTATDFMVALGEGQHASLRTGMR